MLFYVHVPESQRSFQSPLTRFPPAMGDLDVDHVEFQVAFDLKRAARDDPRDGQTERPSRPGRLIGRNRKSDIRTVLKTSILGANASSALANISHKDNQ